MLGSNTKKNTVPLSVFGLFVFSGIALVLWHCQYGVDLTDEAFYLAPAWKLFSLGDRLFVDEIFNGPRHSDALNYFLVQPFVPFSVLWIRVAAVLLYAVLLSVFVCSCFAGRCGGVAGLVFFAVFVFDSCVTPTWSYNWWSRTLLLFHHSLLLISFRFPKPILFFFAGIALGLLAVAHNPLIAVVLFLLLCFWGMTRLGWFSSSRGMGFYIAGVLVALLFDIQYLLRPSVGAAWIHAFTEMKNVSDYSGVSSFGKLAAMVHYVLASKDFWFCLLASLIVLFPIRWGKPIWRAGLAGAVAGGYLLQLFLRHTPNDVRHFECLVGVGVASALCLLWVGGKEKKGVLILMALGGLATAFVMGMASAVAEGAMLWVMPTLIVPWVALLKKRVSVDPFSRVGYALALGMILFIGVGASYRQLFRSYFDVPPMEATTKVQIPPLQGIYTSSRRAYLTEFLSQLMEGKKFALIYPNLPGPFLFHQVRSSINTTIAHVKASASMQRAQLKDMVDRQRFPEVIIRANEHPWGWGIQPHPLVFRDRDPFERFTKCVTSKVLHAFPEFTVFEVERSRVRLCALEA